MKNEPKNIAMAIFIDQLTIDASCWQERVAICKLTRKQGIQITTSTDGGRGRGKRGQASAGDSVGDFVTREIREIRREYV